jgi:succinate dehydrogenase/fumarate reductase cytochrome b subunit
MLILLSVWILVAIFCGAIMGSLTYKATKKDYLQLMALGLLWPFYFVAVIVAFIKA